jgi:predicted hydrocarbon binding protein
MINKNMESIPKSGLFYPNKIARGILLALEELIGKKGLQDLLTQAGLSSYIGKMPPDNFEWQFDFSDFSLLCTAIDEIYGPAGGRNLSIKVGRAGFEKSLNDYGVLGGFGGLSFKVMPQASRIKKGLITIAQIFSSISDQYTTVDEQGDDFHYIIHKCPVCWGRRLEQPRCFVAVGMIQAGLHHVSGGLEFNIQQTKCTAVGDSLCEFIIEKKPTL